MACGVIQTIEIDVIDDQEDYQRGGHATGHNDQVVEVIDQKRNYDQQQVVDPHAYEQGVEPDALDHLVFDLLARESDHEGSDDRPDDSDVVHNGLREKPAGEVLFKEADRTTEQECRDEDHPTDPLKTVGQQKHCFHSLPNIGLYYGIANVNYNLHKSK